VAFENPFIYRGPLLGATATTIEWWAQVPLVSPATAELPRGRWVLLSSSVQGGLTSYLRRLAYEHRNSTVAYCDCSGVGRSEERLIQALNGAVTACGLTLMSDLGEFPERLTSLGITALMRGTNLLIVVDGLRHIRDEAMLVHVVEAVHTVQKRVRATQETRISDASIIAVVGVGLDLWRIWRVRREPSEIFRNFEDRWIRWFSRAEVCALLTAGLSVGGYNTSQDVVEAIWDEAGGHPGLTQRYGCVAYTALEGGMDPVGALRSAAVEVAGSAYFMDIRELLRRDAGVQDLIDTFCAGGSVDGALSEERARALAYLGLLARRGDRWTLGHNTARMFFERIAPTIALIRAGERERSSAGPVTAASVLDTVDQGRTLLRYCGYLQLLVRNASGEDVDLPRTGMPTGALDTNSSLIIRFATIRPDNGCVDAVNIPDGDWAENVRFRVVIDVQSGDVHPRSAQILVPTRGQSGECPFAIVGSGILACEVHVYQETRLLQVLPVRFVIE
jgi:hypothetical protein